MERVRQPVGKHGLQIPLALMDQYGLKHGDSVVVEFEEESIRVIPVHSDRRSIENRALRYLLHEVGDGVSVQALPFTDGDGWQVDVYGGSSATLGTLYYDSNGKLHADKSTSPEDMRRTAIFGNNRQ